MINKYSIGSIKEIVDESNCCIIVKRGMNNLIGNMIDGVMINVKKLMKKEIPIIVLKDDDEVMYPEILLYKNSEVVGSLRGVRQVSEIINYIDKLLIE